MTVRFEMFDNETDSIVVDTESSHNNDVFIEFAPGVGQMSLSIDKARQLIEYLEQAIADVEGHTT